MINSVLLINWIETRSYLRDRTALFWTFIYPVSLLVILHYMFGGASSTEEAQSAYSAFLISGMASMTIVTTALFGFSVVLVSLRYEGKLKLYEVLPIKKVSYLVGFGLSRLSIMVVFSLLFVIVADFFYDSSLQLTIKSIFNFLILTLIGGFSFIAIGLALVSLTSKPSTASALINIVSLPVLFLSDLFIPIDILPNYVQLVAIQSPVYIFVSGIREVLNNAAPIYTVWKEMSLLIIIGLISLFYAMKTFKWSPPD